MNSKPIKKIFGLLLGSILVSGAAEGAPTYQEIFEARFDHVSTFDELEDWSDTCKGDCFKSNGAKAPVRLDAKKPMWTYWSFWNSEASSYDVQKQSWIGNHGSDLHGTPNQLGRKSMALSVESPNRIEAPSRIGASFGNGTTNSGYKEMYVFYRLKINSNQWPTNTSVEPDMWKKGDPYAYFFSWKHFNVGVGFNDDYHWNDATITYDNRYGDTETLVHLKTNNNQVIARLENQNQTENYWSNMTKSVPTDKWIGIEYRMVLESPAYAKNGIFQMWIYDGREPTLVLDVRNARYRTAGNDDHWLNRIVFGGNNSQSFTWGPTMNSVYYIDDVIVDDTRIGPTYYDLITPSKPNGIKITHEQK